MLLAFYQLCLHTEPCSKTDRHEGSILLPSICSMWWLSIRSISVHDELTHLTRQMGQLIGLWTLLIYKKTICTLCWNWLGKYFKTSFISASSSVYIRDWWYLTSTKIIAMISSNVEYLWNIETRKYRPGGGGLVTLRTHTVTCLDSQHHRIDSYLNFSLLLLPILGLVQGLVFYLT